MLHAKNKEGLMKKSIKKLARNLFPKFYSKLGQIKMKKKIEEFKKVYPSTKIFYEESRKLYSQDNQDYIVYNNFLKIKKMVSFVM